MASKRSRATFEADLQAQQSPYVIYGTPLPPLDPDTRDDGSYVPVWKQEVTDEQGRKRLHGAFTGGFSAGYFNTVGSKEGWMPSAFVSSRSNRKKNDPQSYQKPEDFMDEEDLAEAEEARKLDTADNFAGLGSAADHKYQDDSFMGILRTTGTTMGMKLMQKMGWREGQGVGPKSRRKARVNEDQSLQGDSGQEMHLFAPENSEMISFIRKTDRKGLGHEGEDKLDGVSFSTNAHKPQDMSNTDGNIAVGLESLSNGNVIKKKKPERKGGFGTGVLNDNGSDDEDPYSMGPQISYNRTIGGDKKKKKKAETSRSSANPLLNSKPVFISKQVSAAKSATNFRKCHDGRLPLDGFVLSSNSDPLSSIISLDGKYPPPTIPQDWKSSKTQNMTAELSTAPSDYQSIATVAAASKLSPKSRAAVLGEAPLPGKSVFDFLTPNARTKIASAAKNDNLPPALSEASGQTSFHPRTLQSVIPPLARETAQTALGRGTAGWMPYAEDLAKRARYRTFLKVRAGLRPEGTLPDRSPGSSNEEWINEMKEFAHAAQIFKPMTGAMATRFTSSSSAPQLASDNVKQENVTESTGDASLLTKPTGKTRTPAEEAAAVGMYGPLTRSVQNFYPTRLLCKRFNVQPPAHVQIDPGGPAGGFDSSGENTTGNGSTPQTHSTALPQRSLELVGKKDMDELRMADSRTNNLRGLEMNQAEDSNNQEDEVQGDDKGTIIDPERNEALEKDRPGEAVFKAIFGNDSENE
ncbi:hypothetical protein ACLMJK_004082 [Lecanora helva]